MDEEIQISLGKQIILYFGTVVGVLFSPVLVRFQTGEVVSLDFPLRTIIISIFIALVIIPVVFEKLSVNPKAPFLAQFGLFVQNGVFWYLIFSSLGKAIPT